MSSTDVLQIAKMDEEALEIAMDEACASASSNRASLSRGANPNNVNLRGLIVKATKMESKKNPERKFLGTKLAVYTAGFSHQQYAHLDRHLCSTETDRLGRTVLRLPIRRKVEPGETLSDRQKLPENETEWKHHTIRPMQIEMVVVFGLTAKQCKPSEYQCPFVELLDLTATRGSQKKNGDGQYSNQEGDHYTDLKTGGIDFYNSISTQTLFDVFERAPDEQWFLPNPDDLFKTFPRPGVVGSDPVVLLYRDSIRLKQRMSGGRLECLAFPVSIERKDWMTTKFNPQMILKDGACTRSGTETGTVGVELRIYEGAMKALGFLHLREIWENVAPFSISYCPFVATAWINEDTSSMPINRKHLDRLRGGSDPHSSVSDSRSLIPSDPDMRNVLLKRRECGADNDFSHGLILVADNVFFDMETFLSERLFPVTAQWVAKKASQLCCNDQASKDVDAEAAYVCITGSYSADPSDVTSMKSKFVQKVMDGKGEFRVATNTYFPIKSAVKTIKDLSPQQGDSMLDAPGRQVQGCPFPISHMGGRAFYVLYYLRKGRSDEELEMLSYMGIAAKPAIGAPPSAPPALVTPTEEERKKLPANKPRGAAHAGSASGGIRSSSHPNKKARIASPPASDSEETTDEDDSN